MAPRMSVVIVAKNEAKTLPKLLKRLREQTLRDFELVFIDNMSTDETPVIVKRFAEKGDIPVIYERAEGTLGSLYNRAIDLARTEYVVIIGGDEIPVRHWIEEHYECLARKGCDACLAPVVYIPAGSKIAQWYYHRSLLEVFFNRYYAQKRIIFNSGNLGMKTNIIRRLRFDPRLGVSEDGEMSYRFIKHGYRLCFNPHAIAFHPAPDNLWKHVSFWRKLAYAQRVLLQVHPYRDLVEVIVRNNIVAHIDPRELVKSSLWKTRNLPMSVAMHLTALFSLLATHALLVLRPRRSLYGYNIQRAK